MRSKSKEVMNKIVDYINEEYFSYQHIPTTIEIGEHIGMTNGAVSKYLADMIESGMIVKDSRFLGFKTPKIVKSQKASISIPIVGEIACGLPMFAEENIEDYITISSNVLGQGEFFVLRAKGKSMIDAGIEPGDLVVIRKQNTANEGQIVAAMIDGECTLKSFYIDNKMKRFRLHPNNTKFNDQYYDAIDIQGVAVKIIKDIKNEQ